MSSPACHCPCHRIPRRMNIHASSPPGPQLSPAVPSARRNTPQLIWHGQQLVAVCIDQLSSLTLRQRYGSLSGPAPKALQTRPARSNLDIPCSSCFGLSVPSCRAVRAIFLDLGKYAHPICLSRCWVLCSVLGSSWPEYTRIIMLVLPC